MCRGCCFGCRTFGLSFCPCFLFGAQLRIPFDRKSPFLHAFCIVPLGGRTLLSCRHPSLELEPGWLVNLCCLCTLFRDLQAARRQSHDGSIDLSCRPEIDFCFGLLRFAPIQRFGRGRCGRFERQARGGTIDPANTGLLPTGNVSRLAARIVRNFYSSIGNRNVSAASADVDRKGRALDGSDEEWSANGEMLHIPFVDRQIQTPALLQDQCLAWLVILGRWQRHNRAWAHLNALIAPLEQYPRFGAG